MAAPTLRHYSFQLSTLTSTYFTVPTGRALVISKLLVAGTTSATNTSWVSLQLNYYIAQQLLIGPSQVYTETGLVAVAGEGIQATASLANAYHLHIFGEEVDN